MKKGFFFLSSGRKNLDMYLFKSMIGFLMTIQMKTLRDEHSTVSHLLQHSAYWFLAVPTNNARKSEQGAKGSELIFHLILKNF